VGGVVRCSAVVMGVVVVFASPCSRVFDKEGKGREGKLLFRVSTGVGTVGMGCVEVQSGRRL